MGNFLSKAKQHAIHDKEIIPKETLKWEREIGILELHPKVLS